MFKFHFNKKVASILFSAVLSFVFVFVAVNAATTISTNISTAGTLAVTSTSTLTGRVGVGAAPTTADVLQVTGTTTSSLGMTIGTSGSDINQVLHGTCTIDFGATITGGLATTTNCTATGVATDHKVFVTPNNLEATLVFNSASATAANVIQVQIFNATGTGSVTMNQTRTWSWMAIK